MVLKKPRGWAQRLRNSSIFKKTKEKTSQKIKNAKKKLSKLLKENRFAKRIKKEKETVKENA